MLATSAPRWREDPSSPFVFKLARSLAAQGLMMTLVVPRGPLRDGTPAPAHDHWDGVDIIRFSYCVPSAEVFAYGAGIMANFRRHPVRMLALMPAFSLRFGLAARHAAAHSDLVHCNWVISALVAQTSVRRLPVVVTPRENNIAGMFRRRIVGHFLRRGLHRANGIIAFSRYQRDRLAEAGIPGERIRIVPNGVDLPPALSRHRGSTWDVLWVGRVAPEKDLPTLLRAFRIVCSACPDARLTVLGDGPALNSVRQLAVELGLAHSARFTGWASPDEVAATCAKSDVLVCSSLTESGPNVVLEGMAHGLPVVSTPVGLVPDLVRDGENGRIVPVGDCSAMAQALLSVMGNVAVRDRMGRAGRATVERMTWARTARAYRDVFEQAIQQKAQGKEWRR